MPDIKTQTKIAVLIEKINYLFSTVQQNGGALTKIDKDLMMNYVKELYECTLSLQVETPQQPQQYQQQQPYGNQPYQQQQQPPAQENYQPQQQPQQYQPPAQPQYQPQAPQQNQPQAPQQNQSPVPQQNPQQTNGHNNGYQNGSQQLNGNTGNGNGNYTPQPPQPNNEPVGNGHSINQSFSTQGQRKTLSDMYTIKTGAEKPSVNEKLNQPKHELADKLKKSPIKDLKVYIGLNKRFSYINFLFNNDAKLYDEAINTINNSANYNDAMRYIERELLPRLKWHADDETVREFYNIVERRYLA